LKKNLNPPIQVGSDQLGVEF